MTDVKLSPSILAADFCNLGRDIQTASEAGCEAIHFDVMDGLFVPSISMGFPIMKSVRKNYKGILDVHLMIVDPDRYVEEFVKEGADYVTIHLEACPDEENIVATLEKIRSLGCKAGLAINPETPAEELAPFLKLVDLILVMTVHPGFGGQKYIHECTAKIAKVRDMLTEAGLADSVEIQVDGGIGDETIREALEAGATFLVAGSSVFKNDIAANVEHYRGIISEYKKN